MTNGSAQFDEGMARTLAGRIRSLRDQRGLTLDALARASGVSKGTVVALEQGKANPSIGVLCKLAAALCHSVTDLISPGPPLSSASALEVTTPATLWSSRAGGEGWLAASLSGPTMFELWHWTLAPGDRHQSDGHRPGTWELVSVSEGSLEIAVKGETVTLTAGQAARCRTDRPHSYANVGDTSVRFTMAVLEVASPDMSRV